MNPRRSADSLKAFFYYAAISSFFTMITTHFEGKDWTQIMSDFGYRYAYGMSIGIISGLGWMFGQDLYFFKIKKKKNEPF